MSGHQAFWLLRIAFTVAPILFGVDKFFNWTVSVFNWTVQSSTGPSTGPTIWRTGSTTSSRSPQARTSCTSSAAWRSRPG